VSKHNLLTLAVVLMLTITFGLARAAIRIAVAGPITGKYEWTGEEQRQGAALAVAHLNAKGGVLGQKVDLIIGDDACNPGQAVAVAKKLVSDGVVFVTGHFCSHSSIPASKVYESAGILMISPASTNPQLTDEGGANVFRVCGRDDQQGVVAGTYLAEHWADKRIAILHDNTTYGKGLADETKKQLNKRGVKETLYAAYRPGETDYSAVIDKMKAAGIEVLYLGGYSTEAGLILRQAHDQGYKVQLVSGDSLSTEEFWMLTGPAGAGTLLTFGPDPRRNPEAASVIERFRAQNFEPAGYTLYSYAAVQVWAQAVEKAGSLNLARVIKALRSYEFDTVLGKIGFDDKGDVKTHDYVWYVWQDGQLVPKK
jgi:branched-chain amino acid transport system substrate-binding protein